jgi:hypothetical protein
VQGEQGVAQFGVRQGPGQWGQALAQAIDRTIARRAAGWRELGELAATIVWIRRDREVALLRQAVHGVGHGAHGDLQGRAPGC